MKFSSFYPDLRFKLVFENAAACNNSRCRSVLYSAKYELQVLLTVPIPAGSRSRSVTCDALFT